MTSTGVENLAFDTEQRQRSAYVLPKLPPAVENTLKTAQDVGQEAGPVAENDGQVGFGAIMLRKMGGDGRQPKPNGEIRADCTMGWYKEPLEATDKVADETIPTLPLKPVLIGGPDQ